MIKDYVTPNSGASSRWVGVGWIVLLLVGWQLLKPAIMPGPVDAVLAIPNLFAEGLTEDLLASLWANIEALVVAGLLALPVAYLSRVPVVRPLADTLGRLRYVGSAVFYLPLVLLLPDGHYVKVGLLALGQAFYIATTMTQVVLGTPQERFDDAYTLKMGEWQATWYVVVRGTVPQAIDALVDNFGTGWGMLMYVEGALRYEGGVGVVLLVAEKYGAYADFFAAAFIVMVLGFQAESLKKWIKGVVCPYA
jgi:ABC-type nitrate/sulfonate/bicarbonate transport system permease component